jgi:hypothetical protein
MPAPSQCCSPCNNVESVEVPGPQGDPGTDGADGTNGTNAYTIVTTEFVVPALGGSITIDVGDSTWAAVGQPVFIPGAGVFEVLSIPSSTTLQLEYLDYETNVETGSAVVVGSAVTPGGFQEPAPTIPDDQVTAYGSGAEYVLTTTPANVVMGGTSPDVTLTVAGTWMIFARLRVDYNAATFAAVRTVTGVLRRTNNTAGNITNSSASFETEIITTLTYTAEVMSLPVIIYKTANVNDNIVLQASIDVLPTAGSIAISQCEIVAVRINDETT